MDSGLSPTGCPGMTTTFDVRWRVLHDGQFPHVRHAQIARRVTLSQFLLLLKNRSCGYMRGTPPRHEGRYGQSSRNVRRDAMDARSAQGRSAHDASDEAVWSRHPDAGVKFAI